MERVRVADPSIQTIYFRREAVSIHCPTSCAIQILPPGFVSRADLTTLPPIQSLGGVELIWGICLIIAEHDPDYSYVGSNARTPDFTC